MNQTIADTLDKIDKLPSGDVAIVVSEHSLRGTGFRTEDLQALSTHLRKLMQEDETVRKIWGVNLQSCVHGSTDRKDCWDCQDEAERNQETKP